MCVGGTSWTRHATAPPAACGADPVHSPQYRHRQCVAHDNGVVVGSRRVGGGVKGPEDWICYVPGFGELNPPFRAVPWQVQPPPLLRQ
jgi:hypothetical protein